MARIDGTLLVSSNTQDRTYSADHVALILDGGGGGGGGGGDSARTAMVTSYSTMTTSPTVYYTALHTDGSVLSARSTTGVTFANGLWQRTQSAVGITDFIVVWDEGDVSDYAIEWITVDT